MDTSVWQRYPDWRGRGSGEVLYPPARPGAVPGPAGDHDAVVLDETKGGKLGEYL